MKSSQIIELRNKEYSKFQTLTNIAIFMFIVTLGSACMWSLVVTFFTFIIGIGLTCASSAPYNRSKVFNSRLSSFDKWVY